LKEEKDKLRQLVDLYSGLIDNTAESFRILYVISKLWPDYPVPNSLMNNNDVSIKLVSDWNEYISSSMENILKKANANRSDFEKVIEEVNKMSGFRKIIASFVRFFSPLNSEEIGQLRNKTKSK
jgi:hypothetical protein